MIRVFQFVILLLGLGLVALGSAIVTMRFAIHGAEVTVPNLKGMSADEALNKAAELGVEMTIDNRFYSAEVPAGRILNQSPAAGTEVRREWHIRAIESLGPQRVAIPRLVGEPQRSATMQLRRLGLNLDDVAQMPFPSAPEGSVIAQAPPAGATGVEQPSVSILVSGGGDAPAAAFVTPDFTGKPIATVTATIARSGLKLGRTQAVDGTNQAPGTVIRQSPLAGYSIDADTPLELIVVR